MNPNNNNSKRNKNRSAATNMSSTMSNSNISNRMHRGPSRNSSGPMPQLNYNNAQSQPNNVSNKNLFNLESVEGVYNNKRFMHSITSLIGCLIEIKLKNGKRYEGILRTFSPQFEVVIFCAAPVVDDNEKRNSGGNIGNLLTSLEKKEEIVDKLVINLKEMVHFKSANVNLDYATILKKTMLTDTEISKLDGKNVSQKELVPWSDDYLEFKDEGLEENGVATNGWDSNEMFRFNENTYNVTSTYRDDMTGYTIPLEHRNDEEYQKRMVKAEQISREIEQDSNRQLRYAKENEADEETRFSAVVRDSDEPNQASSNSGNNNNNSNNSAKNDLNHSLRPDDRRDQLRNNTDNAGFRMANNRQNRNRTSAGRNNSSGVNDSNWREPAARMNTNRFHNQSASSYTGPSSKPGNNQMGGGGYGQSSKYSPASNVNSNQYSNNSQNKTYSAVSASRHAPIQESPSNDNESKQFSNRVHVNKSDQHPNDSDSYSRRTIGGLSQRENFKRNAPRTPDHEPTKPVVSEMAKGSQSSSSLPTKELDNAKAPSLNVSNVTSTSSDSSSPVKPSPRSDSSNNQQSKPKQNDDNKPIVEMKKYDQQQLSTAPVPSVAPQVVSTQLKESIKEVEPAKKEPVTPSIANSPVASTTSTSQPPTNVTTPTLSTTTPPASTPVDKSPPEEVIKTSNLNPNAKSFTPRVSNSSSASTSPYVPSQTSQVAPNQYAYSSQQHMSTTPPTITSTQPIVAPGQYLQIHPGATHPQHHHQQQVHPQQPHNMGPRYNQLQFPAYNNQMLQQQMVPQHYILQSIPNGMQHFPGAVQSGVPAPQMAPQNAAMNSVQNGAGQMTSHHLVSNPNSSGPSQGITHNQQPQQGPPQRGPYRGKGGQNHNSSNPNQQAPQYLRQQQQHHMEQYNQQSQVANVTGQPIMAATAPPNAHQMSIAYSTAPAIHPHQHHHHPSQQHGQQQQNMAAQLSQPGPGQMPYTVEYQNFQPRPINLIPGHPQGINIANIQPGLHYDPQLHPIYMQLLPNQMQPSIQGNPNMQPPGPGSNASAPSIPSTPSNQIPQGSVPPQGY